MDDVIIIDTDILIDFAHGVKQAATFLNETKLLKNLSISSVTEMELMVGCGNKKELKNLEYFLSDFNRFKINEEVSDTALKLLRQYRLSHGLLIPDALIAATAIVNNTEFITRNYKDFRFIPELKLLKYS